MIRHNSPKLSFLLATIAMIGSTSVVESFAAQPNSLQEFQQQAKEEYAVERAESANKFTAEGKVTGQIDLPIKDSAEGGAHHDSTDVTDDIAKRSGLVDLLGTDDLSKWRGSYRDPADEVEVEGIDAETLMRKYWKLDSGVLSYVGPRKGVNIRTNADYKNFELYIEWKVETDGDSGIYLRGFPQVQIWDTQSSAYQGHGADRGSGGLWNNYDNGKHPLIKADKPAGSWNQFYIKMVDDRVLVKLNGQIVTDNIALENYWNRQQPVAAAGPIELQSFAGKVSFRNIHVRELESTAYAGGNPSPKKASLRNTQVVRRQSPSWNTRSNYSNNHSAQMSALRQAFEGQRRHYNPSQSRFSGPGWNEDQRYSQYQQRSQYFGSRQRFNQNVVPGMQPIPRRAMGFHR